ncbi:MAG: pyridoxine 5'-phosphate synthase [Chitinophagaceae bacterium]|nr:pyridoxine 5'-phosphate synthase [Chitinophagaceae bacterium]
MTSLSVNINKIATLRNSRGGIIPTWCRRRKMCRNLVPMV